MKISISKPWLALSLWLVSSYYTNTLPAHAADSIAIRNIYINADKQLVVEFDNPSHITPTAPQVLDYPGEKHDIILEFSNTSFAVGKVPRAKVVLDELTKTFPSINSIAYAASSDATRARIRLSIAKDISTHPTLTKIDQDVAIVNLDLPPSAASESNKETANATAPVTAPTTITPIIAAATPATTLISQQSTAELVRPEGKEPAGVTENTGSAATAQAPALLNVAPTAATSPAVSAAPTGRTSKAVQGIKGAWQSSLKTGSGQISKLGKLTSLFGSKKKASNQEAATGGANKDSSSPVSPEATTSAPAIVANNVGSTTPPAPAADNIGSTATTPATTPTAAAADNAGSIATVPPTTLPVTTTPAPATDNVGSAATTPATALPVATIPAPATDNVGSTATTPTTTPTATAADNAGSIATTTVPPTTTTPTTSSTTPVDNVGSMIAPPATTNPSTTDATPGSMPSPKALPKAVDNTDNTASATTPDVSLSTNTGGRTLDLPRIVVQPQEAAENQQIKNDLITPLKPDEVKPEQKSIPSAANTPEIAPPLTTKTIEGDPTVTADLKTGFSKASGKESKESKEPPTPQIASAVPSNLTDNLPAKEPEKPVTRVELKSMAAHSGGKDYFPPKTSSSEGSEPTYSEETLKHYNEAVRFHLAGKLPEAVAEYHAALAGNPRMEEAHSNLGLIFNQQNKYDQAMAEFHKALAINPKDAITYNGIGAAMRAQKNMLAAVKNWQTALSLDANLASAHYNLGTAYELDKDLERALTEYKLAVKCDDKLGEAYYHMGLILQKMDNRPLALEQFKQAVKVSAQADYAQDAKHRVNLLSQKKGELIQ